MKEAMHNLYQETLMNHYRKPRNKGIIQNPDFCSGSYNPLCGDAVSMGGIITDDILTAIMFEGKGCVISQAGASLLTQKASGRSIGEINDFDANVMQSLIGISLGPTRLKCALLPLHALQEGLKKYVQTKRG